ncbi:hypothetical protein ACFRU3_31145 [Streptomyces sp. NPDC056910]
MTADDMLVVSQRSDRVRMAPRSDFAAIVAASSWQLSSLDEQQRHPVL